MSDPRTIEENLEAMERGFERQNQSRRKRSGKSNIKILDYIDTFSRGAEMDDTYQLDKKIEIFSDDPPTFEQNDIKHRVRELERKVEWLIENQIEKQSNSFLQVIKDEFSCIPFIKEMYIEKISDGYDLIIIHDEKDTKTALSLLIKTKIKLRDKLKGIHLDLTVIRYSDFNKNKFGDKLQLFQRELNV